VTAARSSALSRWRWELGAGVAFVLFAFGSGSALDPIRVAVAGAPPRGPSSLARAECPPGTVPDQGACVHLAAAADDGLLAPVAANAHHDKRGRFTTYDQIPRLPERPADYDAYRYPIPAGLPGGHHVVSGYDLDRADGKQRRGARLSHVGHGGVDLPQAKGTPVKMIALEHQEGDAEVLYTGTLFGTTVVTHHTLREGGRLRDYVVLFGHLDAIGPGVTPGRTLKEGETLGAVGDTGSPELVHLHLEVRRVRDGVDVTHVPAGAQLLSQTVSVVCDPRNVLPLK
jgi:murein DD-endopeptidase MepM/ murein hydrolase activator NlpD